MDPSQSFPSLLAEPDGSLTGPDGLPDGSKICKHLITREVDGLTGKTPPGSHTTITERGRPRPQQAGKNPGGPPIAGSSPTPVAPRSHLGPGQSNPVQPSPTKSNRSTPHPWSTGNDTVKFLAIFDHLALAIMILGIVGTCSAANLTSPNDYAAVDSIFTKYCLDCHASKDPEGELVLESFDSLMKGGEIGPAILPGKSTESVLTKMVEGRFEKEGKKKIMPPGKRAKLTPMEIATVKSWIDAGAPPPYAPLAAKELVLPKVAPKCPPRDPINGLASIENGTVVAVARYGKVELWCSPAAGKFRTFDFAGTVNAVAFTQDGSRLFAAGGQAALSGEVRVWTVSETNQSRALVRSFTAHKDAIYSIALSPDDKILATGSYDQKIKLWEVESGKELKTLSGHNGCIFGLAFRPDGKILASASADRTVKLWDVASGERRDTLSQPLKEVYAVEFSPNGKRLAAGGADNRIRIWEISESAAETTNPLLHSKFGHEGTILRLAYSPDGKTLASTAEDRTVKLWDAEEMRVRRVLEEQPDWPTSLAFAKNSALVVGRLDGTLKVYELTDTTQSSK